MARHPSGSAALLISVHSDQGVRGRWYARVVSYDDALLRADTSEYATSVDGVCSAVRRWMEAVTGGEHPGTRGPV